ncbi:MAG: hypothetical protein ABI333_27380 [bacterium]
MTRLFSTALALLFAAGLSACEKDKKKTTPDPEERRAASVVMSSKGAKMAKCKRTSDSRMVTLDLNRDKKRDRWLLLDAGNRKICHEMDTDFDGNPDISITYFNDGLTPRVVWWDLDYDGTWDQVMYNRPDGTKERVEIRPYPTSPKEKKSTEWKPLVWKYYRNIKGRGTIVDRIEMDKDRNGYKDYWERYEDGKLREVSWANAGDTDEKPKHWIESPEEGQDKGYGGQDEPKEVKPTKGTTKTKAKAKAKAKDGDKGKGKAKAKPKTRRGG